MSIVKEILVILWRKRKIFPRVIDVTQIDGYVVDIMDNFVHDSVLSYTCIIT